MGFPCLNKASRLYITHKIIIHRRGLLRLNEDQMENQAPQNTPENNQGNNKNGPEGKKILFALSLVLIAVGMAVGTYYKIIIYGP